MIQSNRKTRFERTERAYMRMQAELFGGGKIPHGISLPVIRKSGDAYRLAAFVFFFTASDVRKGRIGRPTMWVEADIRTGRIIAEHQTRENEFSNAGYKEMLDIRGQGISDRKHQLRLLEMLDPIRREASEGRIQNEAYASYLKQAEAEMPEPYRRFYGDLSDISPVTVSHASNDRKRSDRQVSPTERHREKGMVIASFYLDRESYSAIRRMANEQQTSMSAVLRSLLKEMR